MFEILKKQVMGITGRVLRRDFSGDTGIAIKNSIFQFSTSVVSKGGSLLFTAILARMLMPEIFGLYTLSLSTIMIFAAFSDLGIGRALIRYISKNKDNSKKAGAYVLYIRSLKIRLTVLASLMLLSSSFFLAKYYYQKPIFYALVAGALYLSCTSFMGFVVGLFQARNNFRYPFYKEIFFQTIRLVLIPLVILFLISHSIEVLLGAVFLVLGICFFLSILFLFPKIKKYPNVALDSSEKKEVIRFILPLSATALSGLFFGSIDVIMLGRFVESSYLAYYQAAFALLSSAGALIPFSAAFFPLFSRLKDSKLSLALKKSLFFTFSLALLAVVFTFILAPFIVRLIYGAEYLPAILILRFLSVLLIVDSLNAIYSSYFVSQAKNMTLAKILLSVTFLNIILNFFLIRYFLQFSMFQATLGAATATILSRSVLLGLLIKNKN
jgi:O-antigen/teichoic acid export membrane protein